MASTLNGLYLALLPFAWPMLGRESHFRDLGMNSHHSCLSRCDQWPFYMNTRIIEFLSLDQILLVKLKNVSFQLADLKLYRLQFWTFSNVILHLEQGNVYLIKI